MSLYVLDLGPKGLSMSSAGAGRNGTKCPELLVKAVILLGGLYAYITLGISVKTQEC